VKQEFAKMGVEGSVQPTLGTIFQGHSPMHDGESLVVRSREPREVVRVFHTIPFQRRSYETPLQLAFFKSVRRWAMLEKNS
jgi:hypothetical protein